MTITFIPKPHEEKKDLSIRLYNTPPRVYQDGRRVNVLPDKVVQEAIDRIYAVAMQYRTQTLLGEGVERPRGVLIKAEPRRELKEVSITAQAYRRARDISNLFRRDDGSLEVAMHLFTHKDEEEPIITDVLPAYNQQVTPSVCRFAPHTPMLYPDELRYVGWCHSHGDHNTFHSPTDDSNVVNKLPREGNKLSEADVSYLPSLVVNVRGSRPHCSLGVRYFDYEKNSYKSLVKDVPLVVRKSKHRPVDFDLEAFVNREVVEDVSHRRH